MEVALHRPSAPRFGVRVVVMTEVLLLVIIRTLGRGATLALRRHLSPRLFSVFMVLLLTAVCVQVQVIAKWTGRCAIAIADRK